MACQRIGKSRLHVACRIGPVSEIVHLNVALNISSEVCATCILQCLNRTLVDRTSLLELNLRAVIYTRYAAEGEHQRQVLSPSVLSTRETVVAVGRIVVRVHIHHIICSVVIEVVLTVNAERSLCGIKVPVHREVYHVQPGKVFVVRCVVIVSVEQRIVTLA